MPKEDMESMDELLAEITPVPETEPEPKPEINTKTVMPVGDRLPISQGLNTPATPDELSPSGLPNPMGLQLTSCHLPMIWCMNASWIGMYIFQYFKRNQVLGVSPTKKEMELFEEYRKICQSRARRAVGSRHFAVAVRCIVNGKPIKKPVAEEINSLAI